MTCHLSAVQVDHVAPIFLLHGPRSVDGSLVFGMVTYYPNTPCMECILAKEIETYLCIDCPAVQHVYLFI